MSFPRVIDQFLFKNIVTQSYEAWHAWIKEYIYKSKIERGAYERFSKEVKKYRDLNQIEIFNLWEELSEENKEKLFNEAKLFLESSQTSQTSQTSSNYYIFNNVQELMEQYSHTMM